jgi:excisionase family DNA binding protein
MRDNLITVREAAQYLRISARTVYRLIESGQIGAVRIGKQWRIPRSDLDGVVAPGASSPVAYLRINQGSASDVEVSELLGKISNLYTLLGGSGIRFTRIKESSGDPSNLKRHGADQVDLRGWSEA